MHTPSFARAAAGAALLLLVAGAAAHFGILAWRNATTATALGLAGIALAAYAWAWVRLYRGVAPHCSGALSRGARTLASGAYWAVPVVAALYFGGRTPSHGLQETLAVAAGAGLLITIALGEHLADTGPMAASDEDEDRSRRAFEENGWRDQQQQRDQFERQIDEEWQRQRASDDDWQRSEQQRQLSE